MSSGRFFYGQVKLRFVCLSVEADMYSKDLIKLSTCLFTRLCNIHSGGMPH